MNAGEAWAVRQMYGWVVEEGLSANRVVHRLNQLHIRPRKGGQWVLSSVLKVLHNEMYAGVWHYNKHKSCEPHTRRVLEKYHQKSKSSVRVRPRSEWISLVLPKALSIIERERWERVQRVLARNKAFSPRNEKHQYLLKGLVRCAGCDATFVGDGWHGSFYYRCARRCKKVGSIRDTRLNEMVTSALPESVRRHMELPDRSAGDTQGQKLAPEALRQLLRTSFDRVVYDGRGVKVWPPPRNTCGLTIV